MVRLTPEVLARAEERINFLGDRELNLRSHAIQVVENLGSLGDQYQALDFTNNELVELGGFPLLRRVRTLNFTNNHISQLSPRFPASVPFLQSLVLAENSIASLEELAKGLVGLKHLESLVLVGNPVVLVEGYRQFCVQHLPRLESLDYTRIRLKERKGLVVVTAAATAATTTTTTNPEQQEAKKRRMLVAIQNATTREQVERLENLLSLGLFPDE